MTRRRLMLEANGRHYSIERQPASNTWLIYDTLGTLAGQLEAGPGAGDEEVLAAARALIG